jgi:hypothetical protein
VRGDAEGHDGEVVADFDVSLEGGAGYLSPDDEPADVAFDLSLSLDAGGSSG